MSSRVCPLFVSSCRTRVPPRHPACSLSAARALAIEMQWRKHYVCVHAWRRPWIANNNLCHVIDTQGGPVEHVHSWCRCVTDIDRSAVFAAAVRNLGGVPGGGRVDRPLWVDFNDRTDACRPVSGHCIDKSLLVSVRVRQCDCFSYLMADSAVPPARSR